MATIKPPSQIPLISKRQPSSLQNKASGGALCACVHRSNLWSSSQEIDVKGHVEACREDRAEGVAHHPHGPGHQLERPAPKC